MSEAEPEQRGQSLAGAIRSAGRAQRMRAGAWLGQWRWRAMLPRLKWREGADWRIAAAIALLLAAGPALAIAGAHLLGARVQGEIARLQRRAAPMLAQERSDTAARAALREAIRRPAAAALLDRFALVLPDGSSLTQMHVRADGGLEVELATSDPDQLRTALRRDPALGRLREAGQRQGEAGMIVRYRTVP